MGEKKKIRLHNYTVRRTRARPTRIFPGGGGGGNCARRYLARSLRNAKITIIIIIRGPGADVTPKRWRAMTPTDANAAAAASSYRTPPSTPGACWPNFLSRPYDAARPFFFFIIIMFFGSSDRTIFSAARFGYIFILSLSLSEWDRSGNGDFPR